MIIDATWNVMHVNACCMRLRDRYECDVPHPLPLDGKYHMFCSRGAHYDLQNSSMFAFEVKIKTIFWF